VWDHKTVSSHGPARIVLHVRVYQMLLDYMGSKEGADLVFLTSSGEKVTHVGLELEKLGESFGKKFSISPTMNRKQVATAIFKTGSETDEKAAADHMTHSLEVHRSTYQHKGGAEETVSR